MDNKANGWIVGAIALLVAGCGGGESADSSNGGTSDGGTPVKLTFSAVAGTSGAPCDETPVKGVKVITFNAQGKALSTAETSADGQLSVDWPNGAKHASMIYKTTTGKVSVYTKLNSYGSDLGKLYLYDEGITNTCQCKTLTFDWADIQKAMPEYQLSLATEQKYDIADMQPNFDYQVCADAAGKYGKLQAMLTPKTTGVSYAMETDIESLLTQSKISLTMSQFTKAGRPVSIYSDQPLSWAASYTQTATGQKYRFSMAASDQPLSVYVFNEDGGIPAINVGGHTSIRHPQLTKSVRVSFTKKVPIDKTNNLVGFSIVNDYQQTVDNIVNFAGAALKNNGFNYDFPNKSYYTKVSFVLFDSQIYLNYSGPIKGQVPKFEYPSDVMSVLNRSTRARA